MNRRVRVSRWFAVPPKTAVDGVIRFLVAEARSLGNPYTESAVEARIADIRCHHGQVIRISEDISRIIRGYVRIIGDI